MSAPSPRRLDTFSYESPTLSPTPLSPSSRSHFQFPFPAHDAARPSPRRHNRHGSSASIASIASSIGGTLDVAAQSNTLPVNDLAQNAISSLLSPAIVRTGLIPQSALATSSAHRAPTVRDIPPVTLTAVPHVDSSAFTSYLTRIGSLYDNYQRAKTAADDAASVLFKRQAELAERPDLSRRVSRNESVPTTPVPTSPIALKRTSSYFASPGSPDSRRKPSAGRPRRDPYAATPLFTIPSVYFEENFQLENPRTFDVVSERSDIIPQPPPPRDGTTTASGSLKTSQHSGRRALHTNAILQEKLSWYMDTIEVHLISSIATASQSFFAALGSLKELHTEATDLIKQIKGLRSALAQLDNDMAIGGLEVVNLRRKRENVRKLTSAVAQLCDVVADAGKCEELVEAEQFEEANAALNDLEALLEGRPPTSQDPDRTYERIDLRQLNALDGISDGVEHLRSRIGKGFEARFIGALLSDLQQHVESVPPKETMQRWASASMRARGSHNSSKSLVAAYMKTNVELRPALLAALAGLSSSGQATRAATAYREAIMREIKILIRRSLPSSNDDDAGSINSVNTRGGRKLSQQEKSAILARNLRALDPEGAEELLVKVYTNVSEALRRLGFQIKVLLDVTFSIESPKTSGTTSTNSRVELSVQNPQGQPSQIRDEVTQALDLSSILGQAVDVIQTQITKVLKVRSEQNARLPLTDFLRYFTLNRLFADECEAVSSRAGEGLKEVVNLQVKEFLQNMAESERQSINQTLETDRWEAKDFGAAESTILNRILEGMTKTPKVWTSYTSLWEDELVPPHTNGISHTNGNSSTTPEKIRPATFDEQRYILVASAIAALHGIDHFSTLIAGIPSLTSDASLKLLDYLKLFNSRCQQLILGAGATRSAGLKNITTKHLALASQACSFIVALIPYMREYVRRQSPSTSGAVLPEFDKVKRIFQEHQSSIREKLVEIMSQRSSAHINAMRKIDFDALPEGAGVNAYMDALTKETGTLHKVLGRHVAEMELRMIMMPIFGHYSQEWSKAFREATVRTERGKANLLRDAEHLATRFAKMEDSGEFGPNIVAIVGEKQVQPPPISATSQASREVVERVSREAQRVVEGPVSSTTAASDTMGASGRTTASDSTLAPETAAVSGSSPDPAPTATPENQPLAIRKEEAAVTSALPAETPSHLPVRATSAGGDDADERVESDGGARVEVLPESAGEAVDADGVGASSEA